jgi:ribonuclease HII
VACASILAKVERDRMMTELDRKYPQYGFAAHKGYSVPEHLEALAAYGPSPVHRLTFRPVLPRAEARC